MIVKFVLFRFIKNYSKSKVIHFYVFKKSSLICDKIKKTGNSKEEWRFNLIIYYKFI